MGPFTLEPVLLKKVWGGRRLAAMFGDEPVEGPVGEAWICSDMRITSASGAGGQAIRSRISAGWSENQTLGDVVERDVVRLLGRRAEAFPLLIKVLDAERHLSVQVHPSRDYAAKNPGAHLKSEAWYVLEAGPEGAVMAGVTRPSSRDDLRAASLGGEIAELLDRRVVHPGDAVVLPSGVIHALGAGLTVLEVQSASDTTFRLYDWAREYGDSGRELHLRDGIAACDPGAAPSWSLAETRSAGSTIAESDEFELRKLEPLLRPDAIPLGGNGRCVVIVPLGSGVSLESEWGVLDLKPFRASVVPASIADETEVHLGGAEAMAITVL